MATGNGTGADPFLQRRSVSQRRKFRRCGYEYMLHYGQQWRQRKPKGQWLFGHAMEDVATAVASGWITTPDEAAEGFRVRWAAVDPTRVEWSKQVTYPKLQEEGESLARVIVPELQERFLSQRELPEPMLVQEEILFELTPGLMEVSLPDVFTWVRQDMFYDYAPTVLDFKTSDRPYMEQSIELDEQLTDYQLAEEAQGRTVEQLCLCVMIRGTNPRVQWLFSPHRPDHVVDRFKQSAQLIDKLITERAFMQNDRACFQFGACPMVPICYESAAGERDTKLYRKGPGEDVFLGWDEED